MELDIEWVRGQFPAFAEPSLNAQAFFENAGGSYTCEPVLNRLTRFYTQRKVQPYAPYEASRLGGEEMDEARARLAAMLGVDADEVSFGPSTSQNAYVLAQAFRQHLEPGDSIIVSQQDHEANAGVWRKLADDGIEVVEWPLEPERGLLEVDFLKTLIRNVQGRLRLVCFPHCSNVIGAVNPVKEIVRIAHEAGAVTCVDGVSYAPHGFPDVGDMGADIYMFSAYKTYGPHQGIMVVRRDLGMTLPNQGHFFNGESPYKRFTPAGPDHAQVAASAGMVDYFEALSAHHGGPSEGAAAGRFAHDLMRGHELKLLQPLLDYVEAKNSLRLLGTPDAETRAPTVAVVAERPSDELAAELAPLGIMAGGGDFYAVRPLNALGLDLTHGVLRLSFVHYTSAEEVDRLIGALDRTL